MSFYNTTNEKGETLKDFTHKAETQDKIILDYFKKFSKGEFTPSFIWRNVMFCSCPITSVRRSISNLTGQGKLTQTGNKKEGIYGRKENTWKLC